MGLKIRILESLKQSVEKRCIMNTTRLPRYFPHPSHFLRPLRALGHSVTPSPVPLIHISMIYVFRIGGDGDRQGWRPVSPRPQFWFAPAVPLLLSAQFQEVGWLKSDGHSPYSTSHPRTRALYQTTENSATAWAGQFWSKKWISS